MTGGQQGGSDLNVVVIGSRGLVSVKEVVVQRIVEVSRGDTRSSAL